MGIYRLLDLLLQNDPNLRSDRLFDDPKRIVIYYPPYNYHMDPSDMVCVLQTIFLYILFWFRVLGLCYATFALQRQLVSF
jgi:hypothetical protein